ncbi:tryptophan-rich sensory protein [Mammaliicoccus sciuri]|uniref:TspO/MBR family protein n=1 Tax=Mammaliicoccus sciuri TaxID=1296 RepID=UPI0021D398AF|nr:TspO/MBR family protein [Mammaliicoccus sciuri]UXU84009.1 tryptophan-rich sensory protein [Mammaliicoccus sciuri]UXU93856.1 tryptophan-rich sensory protein [Mammaliicoccus sciuri]UXV15806.1 tryptophan-rich sensory protein [Mammaliicoccus sciuri]UXV24066.1 tryptophan-rich sensory protein [Mammaliicoccus sciuri]UXV26849.1 tryptophan-rich sensory protein [Mammaliicoccus sciuri]
MKISKIVKYAGIISAPLVGGRLIGKYAVQNARKDYSKNKKPPFSPPGYIFPIVWPILYLSMGIAHSIITKERAAKSTQTAYYSQLGLNYLWSILYFKYKLRGTALIESYVLLSAVILTTVQFYKVNKSAGLLLIPYVSWSAYASYLTTGNWALNKDNPRYTEK